MNFIIPLQIKLEHTIIMDLYKTVQHYLAFDRYLERDINKINECTSCYEFLYTPLLHKSEFLDHILTKCHIPNILGEHNPYLKL